MSGFFNAIREGFNSTANRVRDSLLSPEELRARQNGKQALSMIKLAAVVSFVASVFFFAIFPNMFTFFLMGLVGFGAREIYEVAENILAILNDVQVELVARLNKENFIHQVTKNTFIAKLIFEIADPDLKKGILFT